MNIKSYEKYYSYKMPRPFPFLYQQNPFKHIKVDGINNIQEYVIICQINAYFFICTTNR